MKTLHGYLVREVLVTLAMTVAVMTLVFLLGNVLKELLGLMIGGHASFLNLIEAIAYLIPFVLVFALPVGMLTATLLVFGRFSADQELTAARGSGISLISLASPILLLSVAVSGLAAWMNMEVGPKSRVAYLKVIEHYAKQNATDMLKENQYVQKDGLTFYIGRKDGTNLYQVKIFQTETNNALRWVEAERGNVVYNVASNKLSISLMDATISSWDGDNFQPGFSAEQTFDYDFNSKGPQKDEPSLSDMSFGQLQRKLAEIEKLVHAALPIRAEKTELQKQARKLNDIGRELTGPVLLQMHRQIAFAFASIGFTLIGIPLGIRAHRRETSIGVAMALVLMLVYYSFVILGQSLETHPEYYPHLILWAPNFLFQAIGGVLLWRANRN